MGLALSFLVNGEDKSALFAAHLQRLVVQDFDGLRADTAKLVFDNRDRRLMLPVYDESLEIAIDGVGMGDFLVADSVDQVAQHVISAKGVFKSSLLERRFFSFHDVTLGAVLAQVAANHGLTLAMDSTMRAQPIAHINQHNESDIHLITRLAMRFAAITKLSSGRLVFLSRNGRTVSGLDMPTFEHVLSPSDSCRIVHSKGSLQLKTQGNPNYRAGCSLVVQSQTFVIAKAVHQFIQGRGLFSYVVGYQ